MGLHHHFLHSLSLSFSFCVMDLFFLAKRPRLAFFLISRACKKRKKKKESHHLNFFICYSLFFQDTKDIKEKETSEPLLEL